MKKLETIDLSIPMKINQNQSSIFSTSFLHRLITPISLIDICLHYPHTIQVFSTTFYHSHCSCIAPPTFPWYTPMLPKNATAHRRKEFRLGRLCAAQALQLLGATQQISLPIGPNRIPMWPNGFTGSIAHSSDLILCAATKHNHTIGLDVESLQSPLPHFPALLEHVCRESVYKALFPVSKQVFDTSAYQITPLSPLSELFGTVCATLTQKLAPALPQGTHFKLHWAKTSTHVAALCHLPLDNLTHT